ncbi:MAG: hypothetical protein HIU91_16115 [Acidobacteria bacterium]|nr:hypothetical protein [Acidobacteriota bacterium]
MPVATLMFVGVAMSLFTDRCLFRAHWHSLTFLDDYASIPRIALALRS